MELKKYKLGELGKVITGKTPKTSKKENFDNGVIPFYTPEDIARGIGITGKNERFITEIGLSEIKNNSLEDESVLVGCIGSDMGNVAYTNHRCAMNQQINAITSFKDYICPLYVYYYLSTKKQEFRKIAGATTTPILPKSVFCDYIILLPKYHIQRKIASVLYNIDRKIEINRAINQNLEAMAKQLYDYWFVQFDFPNEDGKPYKSSGGEMVWNEDLQINIPKNWDVCRLNEFIGKNNTGDWGADEPSTNSIEVGCIRGADIIKLNDLPKRYIKSSNTAKLLSNWDVVIEVSGGSPAQATGRSAYITPGVIERNGGSITCSNFCHAFSFKDYEDSAYFYFVWRMFYDNNIMFNFEGKTSGIKNFMTEAFLANKWLKPPKFITSKLFDAVKEMYAKIDSNIAENNNLIKQRDELLPLLMNGQVSVNSDLLHLFIYYKEIYKIRKQ